MDRMDTERNIKLKKAILEKIREYDTIVIARHQRPDGDALGSSHGLAQILRITFPEKRIIVSNTDISEHLAFLGTEETDPESIDYTNALGIVVDTAGLNRCANPNITKVKELIKIDHHINVSPFGDIEWIEDDASSICEMIANFQYTFRNELKCDRRAAFLLFTGMVTDSGRFKYAETNGNTLRLAGYLMDYGINTQMIYANLYLEDFNYFKFQSHVFEKMNITPNGVAFLYVDKVMQDYFNLSREQASKSVEFMNKIKGCLIWLAFIDNPDGTIRVRLRSRFVTVDKLANKYGGGGHSNASGATVGSLEEMMALVNDADRLLGEYKANNKGWI